MIGLDFESYFIKFICISSCNSLHSGSRLVFHLSCMRLLLLRCTLHLFKLWLQVASQAKKSTFVGAHVFHTTLVRKGFSSPVTEDERKDLIKNCQSWPHSITICPPLSFESKMFTVSIYIKKLYFLKLPIFDLPWRVGALTSLLTNLLSRLCYPPIFVGCDRE